jgi:hypothetical protein
MPSFEPGPAHTCPDPFDDEIPLQLCDSPDDDDNGPTKRAAGIEVLAEADELDGQMVELIEHLEEVPDRARDPIRSPDKNYLEAAAAGIPQQLIETGAPSLCSGDAIGVLGNDFETSLLSHRAEIMKLRLRVLVDSRYAQVKSYRLHICSSSDDRTSPRKPASLSS